MELQPSENGDTQIEQAPDAQRERRMEDERKKSAAPVNAKPGFFRRPAVVVALSVLFVLAAIAATDFLLKSRSHESTDDAFIDAHVVAVAPKVAGRVWAVQVEMNQDVKKRDMLFEIDPRDYKATLAQATAAVQVATAKRATAQTAYDQALAQLKTSEAEAEAARADVAATEAEATMAASDLERSRQLVKGGAISKQELEHAGSASTSAQANLQSIRRKAAAADAQVAQANAQLGAAKAQISAAEAEIEQAQANEAQAQLNLDYTRVIAPTDGRVTNKTVEPGAYVQVGQSLLAIVPREPWVTANFKETQLNEMRPGQPVMIHIDAYPERDFRGHVESIQAGSGARFSLLPPENASGNYVKVVQRVPVKIVFDELPDGDRMIGPGMSAVPTVQMRDNRGAPLILICIAAVAAGVAFFGARFLLSRKGD
jgi:membrane fusion protein, multidrug efflux system